jgi:hypothetical protein
MAKTGPSDQYMKITDTIIPLEGKASPDEYMHE